MEPNQTNAPVSPVEPVAPVEPSAPAEPAAPAASDGEKKTSKGMIVGMVILAIVAVAGIAFGVYEFMQGSEKDSEIANLKTQVTNCANAGNNASESDEPVTVTCPDGTEVEVENTTTETVDTEDYIYVGEWGIKIKKPENWLSYRGYEFTNGRPQAVDVFTIKESLTRGDAVDILPVTEVYCNNNSTNPNIACVKVGGSYYSVAKLVGELAQDEEDPISDEFWSFVTDQTNYSEI